MEQATINKLMDMIPYITAMPFKKIWIDYDEEADVLYVNFKKPSHADDARLLDNDVIVRYEKGDIVGITILNAKKREILKKLGNIENSLRKNLPYSFNREEILSLGLSFLSLFLIFLICGSIEHFFCYPYSLYY